MGHVPVLEINDVAKRFGEFSVLRGASFSVGSLRTHAVIGPNGAGKTTLINTISGLLRPTAGQILLDGNDVSHLSVHAIARRGLIRTSQITSLFAGLTVHDNVEIALVARGKYRRRRMNDADDDGASARDFLAMVDLLGLSNTRVDSLSHGQQRLLELAVALASGPQVLLLDEPTAGMSPSETERFVGLVRKRLKSKYTIVLVEHDMKVVMGVADRISVLHQGEVIADGLPKEIMENPFVREVYVGST